MASLNPSWPSPDRQMKSSPKSSASLMGLASIVSFIAIAMLFAANVVLSESSTQYPDDDVATGWTTSTGATHYDLINESISSPDTGDYVYTDAPGVADEWNFSECPPDVQVVTGIEIKLHIMKDAGTRTLSADVNWSYDGGATYNATKNTGSFPTSASTVTLTWNDLSLTKQECDDLQVRVISVQDVGGDPTNHYIYTANMNIIYTPVDSTPPYYEYDQDNSSNSVKLGDTVNASAYWNDTESSLDTAILRTNETGSWANRSYYSFSSKPEYSNFSIDTTGQSEETICWVIWANDTSGNLNNSMPQDEHCFDVPRPYLEVQLITPIDNQLVARNATFLLNATVTCRDSDCGNVSGRVRYNSSSQYPDADIPTSESSPFYVMDSDNPLNCSDNPLVMNEFCNVTWSVNATGDVGSAYKLGVLFESVESYVYSNSTGNNTISIISCIIDITLQWDNVSFDPIDPGQRSNATGNQDSLYNITVESTTTCNVDLYGRADDLVRKEGGNYAISAGNMSFSNTTNDYNEAYSMDTGWVLFGQAQQPDTNLTTYYWIDVPNGMMEGEYNSSLFIEGVEEGDPA